MEEVFFMIIRIYTYNVALNRCMLSSDFCLSKAVVAFKTSLKFVFLQVNRLGSVYFSLS